MITAKLSLHRKFGMTVALIASLFAFDHAFSMAEQTCSAVLSKPATATDIDKTIRSLSALRLKLDVAKAEGSNSVTITALANEYQKKEKVFIERLEQKKIMTRAELVERMKHEIGQLQSTAAPQEEVQRRQEHEALTESLAIDGSRAVLHPVEPGSYKMDYDRGLVPVKLPKSFDMMATQTTQIIWRKIAELANAKLGSQINPDPSHFKGDKRPVEQVSYDDIQEWLKALNKLSASGEPSLVDVIPDHKKGDVYRLPTEAEWEFVLRGRGQYTEMYNFGEDDEQLSDFAWSKKNANDETHPVAQKLPVVVDGNEFYDMYGNVFEWVADFYHDRLFGGEDPKGPSTGWHRVYRGGGWQDWDTYSRGGAVPETRDNGVGFRFAREARESLP